MSKYELYTLTDMNDNEWTVMEINEPMADEEIEDVCIKNGIDEVVEIDKKEK